MARYWSLAVRRSFASQEQHILGGFRLQLRRIRRISGALIAAPDMPEIGARRQVSPLLAIDRRHGVADIAAERLAAGVVRGALCPAIKAGYR